jgi:hypothetical protein
VNDVRADRTARWRKDELLLAEVPKNSGLRVRREIGGKAHTPRSRPRRQRLTDELPCPRRAADRVRRLNWLFNPDPVVLVQVFANIGGRP